MWATNVLRLFRSFSQCTRKGRVALILILVLYILGMCVWVKPKPNPKSKSGQRTVFKVRCTQRSPFAVCAMPSISHLQDTITLRGVQSLLFIYFFLLFFLLFGTQTAHVIEQAAKQLTMRMRWGWHPVEINTSGDGDHAPHSTARRPLSWQSEVVEISALAFPSVWNFLHRCRFRKGKIFSYISFTSTFLMFYLLLLLLLLLFSTGIATINSIQIGNVNMQMRMFFWVKSSATFWPSYFWDCLKIFDVSRSTGIPCERSNLAKR